jgi:hypothetical protein
MTIKADDRRELAKRLMEQYAVIGSWRRVADCYPGVTFQTLNRIAKEEGEWLPKDKSILVALGLVKAKTPRTKIQKAIDKMARDTRKAVIGRKP